MQKYMLKSVGNSPPPWSTPTDYVFSSWCPPNTCIKKVYNSNTSWRYKMVYYSHLKNFVWQPSATLNVFRKRNQTTKRCDPGQSSVKIQSHIQKNLHNSQSKKIYPKTKQSTLQNVNFLYPPNSFCWFLISRKVKRKNCKKKYF